MVTNKKDKPLVLDVGESSHSWFKGYCERNYISMTAYMKRHIEALRASETNLSVRPGAKRRASK